MAQINGEDFKGRTVSVGQSSGLCQNTVMMNSLYFYIILMIDSRELQLSTSNSVTSDELHPSLNAVLSLPREIISSIQDDSSVHALSIAFAAYNSPALFPVRNTQLKTTASSTVVGSQVVSVQVSGIADGTRLANPVIFQLRLTNSPTTGMNEFVASRRCVFWDFKAASKFPIF